MLSYFGGWGGQGKSRRTSLTSNIRTRGGENPNLVDLRLKNITSGVSKTGEEEDGSHWN